MSRRERTDSPERHSLLQPADTAPLNLRERLLGSLRRAGALAPDALAAGRALGEVTGLGHLALLPTLLSGFFGVCSPQGARVAEAELLALARELEQVRTSVPRQHFAREGVLQLLRDFIGESARCDADEQRDRLRRVMVHGLATGAPLAHCRRIFELCTRLSTPEIELLRAIAASAGDGLGDEQKSARALEHDTALLSVELLLHEGLVRLAPSQQSDKPSSPVPTVLGRLLLSWLTDEPLHQLKRPEPALES